MVRRARLREIIKKIDREVAIINDERTPMDERALRALKAIREVREELNGVAGPASPAKEKIPPKGPGYASKGCWPPRRKSEA